jgi:hypothetical protein
MMQSLHRQLEVQVATDAHKKRLVFERSITRRIPLAAMRKALFETKTLGANLNLSNLISLKLPTLRGQGFVIDAIEITTPVIPPFGVMLTVIDYNGKLRFNVNYKTSIVTREQAESLAAHFERALATVTEALERIPASQSD